MIPCVEQILKAALDDLNGPPSLVQAMHYAVLNGGKRVRPKVVLLTALQAGDCESAVSAAVAIEYFHTASLIADDLPCMDNDQIRRGKPALHCAFSQSTAILASYGLIAEGYEKLRVGAGNLRQSPLNGLDAALYYTTRAIGVIGLTGGQFLDLEPGTIQEGALVEILKKKTSALFELSFILGWIYGGGDLRALPELQRMAASLGLIFQLEDDCQDALQDETQGRLNSVVLMGKERVECLISEEKQKVRQLTELTHLKELHDRVALYFS